MATVAVAVLVLISADGRAGDAGANLRLSTGLEYSTDSGGGILFSTDLSQLRVSERQDY